MNNINLQKIEEISLSIFKIVVIALLSVTLVAILGLILKGVIDYTQKPDTTTPRQEASPPKDPPPIGVDPNNFLEKFLPKPAVPPQVDNSDKILSGYMDKLWGHFDNYQKQCESPLPVDKNTFDAAFPKQIVKEWLKRFGEPFLASQDQFAKIVLSNLKLIEFCKEKKGKSGVFLVLLEWHKEAYKNSLSKIISEHYTYIYKNIAQIKTTHAMQAKDELKPYRQMHHSK